MIDAPFEVFLRHVRDLQTRVAHVPPSRATALDRESKPPEGLRLDTWADPWAPTW